MPNSIISTFQDLQFAWVEVPPGLPKKLYWGNKEWHERRKAAHTSSFMALGLLVNQIGETEVTDRFLEHFNDPKSMISLKEKHYHLLEESNLPCSRSHTDDWACAILSNSLTPDQASLGVDIESRERVLKSGTRRFYEHRDDQTESLQPIEIWCIKEATFKALSSYLNFQQIPHPNLVLTDIALKVRDIQAIEFSFKHYKGTCGILPEGVGPRGICSAWALLCV